MQRNPSPSDLIPTVGWGAAASLLIAALAFSHLLIPVLAGLLIWDLAAILIAVLGIIVGRRWRRC